MKLNSAARIENQVNLTPESQFLVILSASPFLWVLTTAHSQSVQEANKNGSRDHIFPSQWESWDSDVQLSSKQHQCFISLGERTSSNRKFSFPIISLHKSCSLNNQNSSILSKQGLTFLILVPVLLPSLSNAMSAVGLWL